jgi:hypothetical protein
VTLTERLNAAMAATVDSVLLFPDRLAAACAQVLPIDGAGVTATHLHNRRIPLGASDPQSQAAERLQFTLGEGPCLTAQTSRTVVRATSRDLQLTWPVYWVELTSLTPFRSVIALPLRGPITAMTTVELYARNGDGIQALTNEALSELAGVLDTWLIAALKSQEAEFLGLPAWMWSPSANARLAVWRAVGHLASLHQLDNMDALALLRSQAFGRSRDLETTAKAILARPEDTPDAESLSGLGGAERQTLHTPAGAPHVTNDASDDACDDAGGVDRTTPLVPTRHRLSAHQPLGATLSEREVLTALPRGPQDGHELVCGVCDTVLAQGWTPGLISPPAPLLRCTCCLTLNDPSAKSHDPATDETTDT